MLLQATFTFLYHRFFWPLRLNFNPIAKSLNRTQMKNTCIYIYKQQKTEMITAVAELSEYAATLLRKGRFFDMSQLDNFYMHAVSAYITGALSPNRKPAKEKRLLNLERR